MREARLVLPAADNAGTPLPNVHSGLQRELASAFGGFTQTMGFGGWVDNDGKTISEPVAVYDVAIEEDAIDTLRAIARRYCALAEQACVYLRLPTGSVEFVQPEPVTIEGSELWEGINANA